MWVSPDTQNAGNACKDRLYRHIRTFEKIVKNCIRVYNTFSNNEQVIISCYPRAKELRYIYHDFTKKSYHFNEAFRLEYGYDSSTGHDKIDARTVDQEFLYKDIYKNFGFIVKANVNRKPRINLQKQFNKKYYRRFN